MAIKHPTIGRIPKQGRPSKVEVERRNMKAYIELNYKDMVDDALVRLCQSCVSWIDKGKIKTCQYQLLPISTTGDDCCYYKPGENTEPWKRERKNRKEKSDGKETDES